MGRDRVTATGEQTSLADRKRRAGQRLVIGLDGHAVSQDFRRVAAEIRPAGYVLFRRNVAEPAQVRELNRELASLADPRYPALLTVDQEGGRVQRVVEPATRWPAMRTVGHARDFTAEVARAMAIELRALGFNLNFAPVADVDSNPANPVIGDRSFGRDPKVVAHHVATFVTAHQAAGIVACAKHFPGHGDTDQDSHHALPVVEREEPSLLETEFPPFRAAIGAGVGSVMTAHVVYPVWDERYPATLSPEVTGRWLRTELGFTGLVFSDDMEMKAVLGRFGVEEQVRRATRAGVDVFLACKTPELQLAFFEALVRQQEDDAAFEVATTDAANRVDALRERFFLPPTPQPDLAVLGCADHLALADRVSDAGAARA